MGADPLCGVDREGGTNEFRVFDTRLKRAERGSLTEGEWRSVKILKNDKVELNISSSNVSVKTSSRGWGRVKWGRKDIGRHGREIAGCLEPGLCLNTHPLELK